MDRARLRPLLSASRIADRVGELGAAITADCPGDRPLWLIGALKGATFFLADLARAIDGDVRIDFLQASSYGAGAESSGSVRLVRDIEQDINGCDVILVEDIVDSGRTANALLRLLAERGPRSVRLAALLDKPSRRVQDVRIDYMGFEVEDEFVVGYGLDAAERFRNLPGVWVAPTRTVRSLCTDPIPRAAPDPDPAPQTNPRPRSGRT